MSLGEWIKQNYNTEKYGLPSWRTLLSAIAEVDKRLFKQLAAAHQSKGIMTQVFVQQLLIKCKSFRIMSLLVAEHLARGN